MSDWRTLLRKQIHEAEVLTSALFEAKVDEITNRIAADFNVGREDMRAEEVEALHDLMVEIVNNDHMLMVATDFALNEAINVPGVIDVTDELANAEYIAANPEPDYDYTEIDTYGI